MQHRNSSVKKSRSSLSQLAKLKQRRRRAITFETVEARHFLSANPVITEFMADNKSSLADGEVPPQYPDWIEIYNAGDQSLDLAGWHLTDNASELDKWTFPSKPLGVGEFLVVFASNLDTPDAAGNLHTNFKLSADNGYVALVRPDDTIASEFGPGGTDYPDQRTNISYGTGQQLTTTHLVSSGAAGKFLVQSTDGGLGSSWTGGNEPFNDSGWTNVTTGVGYKVATPITPVQQPSDVYFLPNSSGGFNAYKLITSLATYTAAESAAKITFPGAYTIPASGTIGHMATFHSEAELTGLLTMFSGDTVWVGLTDNEAYGGTEFGNNSGQAIPANGAAPGVNQRGRGWVWTNGEVNNYNVRANGTSIWNDGEPNDSNGEDAAEMIPGTGKLNDLPLTSTRRYIVEWDLNLATNPTPAAVATVNFNPNDGHYMEKASAAMSWTAASANAQSKTFGSLTGHLASIRSAAENAFTLAVAGGEAWIGAHDANTEGSFEWTDAPGQFFSVGNGSPAAQNGAYMNWNPGEPNDSGGEDYTEIYTTGLWNDLPNTSSLSSVIEYDTTPSGMFTVRQVKTAGTIDTLDSAQALLAAPTNAGEITKKYAGIDFIDPQNGGAGHFPLSTPFPLDTAADDDQFAVQVDGKINIPASGNWTFGTFHDDNTRITITGDNGFTATRDSAGCCGDDLFTFNLPSAGFYNIKVVFMEIAGGAQLELFAAQGAKAAFDNTFALIGDVYHGGLGLSAFGDAISTNVQGALQNVNATGLLRIPFNVADTTQIDNLTMRVKYDDGFVAYLNGTEIARRNAPAVLAWNSTATGTRSDAEVATFESINVSPFASLLHNGTNILSFQAMNITAADDDFLILPELDGIDVATGVPRFFTTPTPGVLNSTVGVTDFASEVQFSNGHGFYDNAFQLTLTTPTVGAQIRYTLDGSSPTASTGLVYSGPLTISSTTTFRAAAFKANFQPSDIGTETFIFLNDVITQSANGAAPAGWPTSPLPGGQRMDYGMDPDVVNNPAYSSTIKNDLKSVPSISIVMNLNDLVGASGIYANSGGQGKAWERPTSIELINPDGSEGFQIDAGLRIRGGYSRSNSNPKHAFRFFFRDEYGDSKLNYPLFGAEGADQFDGIDLRTSQNYSWSFGGDTNNIMNRDVFSRDTQRDMGEPYTRSRYYNLYINGQYWGLYQTQERSEASFGETYFGGDKDNYDVVKAEAGPYVVAATDGTLDAWQQLWTLATPQLNAAANEAGRYALYQQMMGNNPDGTRNPAYPVLLDPDNLIDYMLVILYTGNDDGPIGGGGTNNWYGIRDRTGDEGFKFFAHDSEHTLLDVNADRTGPFSNGSNFTQSNPQWLWQQLLNVKEFKVKVADHIQTNFFNGGALTPEKTLARFLERKGEIDRAIVGESARWGDSQVATPLTRDANWVPAINNLVNNYFPQRSQIVLNQLIADGLFPNPTPPTYNQQGGTVAPGFGVQINGSGVVYYTTDGSDPRLPGGAIAPGAIAYNAVENYVGPNAPVNYIVPTGAGSETGWQNTNYTPTGWSSGTLGLGFDNTATPEQGAGFTVRTVDTSVGDIATINIATTLLDGNTAGFTVAQDSSVFLSSISMGDAGSFPNHTAVPGTADKEQYAIRATSNVTIPAGTYTLGVGSDDGFKLRIPGVTFTNRQGEDNTGVTTANDTLFFASPRGHSVTTGTFTLAAPLTTTINLDFFERNGGDDLELSIGSGTLSFSTATFQILQNGSFGWQLSTTQPTVPFAPLITKDVNSDMFNVNSSAYIRIPFTANNPTIPNVLTMQVRYDDGFVAYLNGTEVARRNAPAGTPFFNSAASTTHNDADAVLFETIDISAFKNLIVPGGQNVLSIQGLNRAINNPDFLIDARLSAAFSGTPITVNTTKVFNARVLSGTDWSGVNTATFFVNTPASASNLAITEVNYNPPDPTSGELAALPTVTATDFEFIELRNTSQQVVDLTGVKFVTGITYDFTSAAVTTLAPGQYVIVAKNPAAFALRYPSATGVVGPFGGTSSLNNGGEQLVLDDRFGNVIKDFTYDDEGKWPTRSDGPGATLEVIDTAGDYNDPNNWNSSDEYLGSPGLTGTGPIDDVVINEVTSHTTPGHLDSIELHNVTAGDIDIGGWYLSDSTSNFRKYLIPTGTILPAGGYLVFDESQFNPTPATPGPNDFSLNGAHGDEVWLMKANTIGTLQRFVDDVSFDAAAADESFGRWLDGSGRLYPMVSTTLGGPNSGPRIGPVIISEVMYNPSTLNDDLEFIELYNTTNAAVDLTNWKFDNGVTFTFASGTSLPSHGTLVVVHFDPNDPLNAAKLSTFRSTYNITAAVPLVGGYTGVLDNNGETLRLTRPDTPPVDEPTFTPYTLVDEVRYLDVAPWPTTPDGTGPSLTRKSQAIYGDEGTNWTGSLATPGAFSAQVVGRRVFYNNSSFDGKNSAVNAADDNAIASDKSPLLPGGTASFNNYTSFTRGINGVMIDIQGLPAGIVLSPADFSFKVGNSDTPSVDWAAGPAPTITLRAGAGVGGSDRVVLTWADGQIVNKWLQVTVNSTSNLGLATPDVFYFGNAIGDTGNFATDATVTAADEIAARNNLASFLSPATVSNHYDFNRDGLVNAADQITARGYVNDITTDLNLIHPPSSFALTGGGGGSLSQNSSAASGPSSAELSMAAVGVALMEHSEAAPVSLAVESQPAADDGDQSGSICAYFAALGSDSAAGSDSSHSRLPRRADSLATANLEETLFDLLS